MLELNKMLNDIINDAISIGFPVSPSLERKIHIDQNRYDRVGACYRYTTYPERYEIHLSAMTIKAKENELRNIIAHEVLHSCFLSMEHNNIWTLYKNLMNAKLGYNIQIKYSWHKILK